MIFLQVVHKRCRSSCNCNRNIRRILYLSSRTGEFAREGPSLPNKLGTSGSVLFTPFRRQRPDNPAPLHSRFSILLTGSGTVLVHFRLLEARNALECRYGGVFRRSRRLSGCTLSARTGTPDEESRLQAHDNAGPAL